MCKMVVKTEMKTKEGVVLKTKKDEIMYEHRFETGDVFIPQYNSLMKKSHQAVVDGIKKTIVNNKIKVIVKGYNNEEPIYVDLTPSQANTFNKKIADDVILNQHLFCAYTYQDNDGNDWVGVGFKNQQTKPKSFEDFSEDEKVETKVE